MTRDHQGRWWGTRAEVAAAVGVPPTRVSDWARRGLVSRPVRGWWPLAEVIEAEHATRTSGRGRSRRDTPVTADATGAR